MQKEVKISTTKYTYGLESSKLEIYNFINLTKSEFVFKESLIYKDNLPLSEDEFIKELKIYLGIYKEAMQEYIDYVEENEILFKNPNLSNEFIKEYSIKKYNLKKLYSNITSFYNSLEVTANEQIWLKKRLKFAIHESKILCDTIKELILSLDEINSFINSIENGKITKSIYMLTFVSTIFLPLNLITGFFGMNTGGLFLSTNPYGSLIVFGLIIVVIILILTFKKLIDNKFK